MAPVELPKAPLICLPKRPTTKMAAIAMIPMMIKYSAMAKPRRNIFGPRKFIMIKSFLVGLLIL